MDCVKTSLLNAKKIVARQATARGIDVEHSVGAVGVFRCGGLVPVNTWTTIGVYDIPFVYQTPGPYYITDCYLVYKVVSNTPESGLQAMSVVNIPGNLDNVDTYPIPGGMTLLQFGFRFIVNPENQYQLLCQVTHNGTTLNPSSNVNINMIFQLQIL